MPKVKKPKAEAEVAICDLCGDNQGPLDVRAACHMTAPLSASLEDGILTLRCYVPTCNRVVCSFRVSSVIPSNV